MSSCVGLIQASSVGRLRCHCVEVLVSVGQVRAMLGLLLLCQLQVTVSAFLHRAQRPSGSEQPDAAYGKALPARVSRTVIVSS